jgi:hypothetical protein
MIYEVQAHFQNGGHVSWHEDIEDEEQSAWLGDKLSHEYMVSKDAITGRFYGLCLDHIAVLLLIPRQFEEQRNSYASHTGKIQSIDQAKYKDGNESW